MKVTTTHEIAAGVDDVWVVMGERFADIADWSTSVLESSLDGPLEAGSTRTCKLAPTPAGLDTIQETLTAFDRDRRMFGFDIVAGLPGFMRKLRSEWRLEEAGPGRTRAINTLTIEVKWYMSPMLPIIRSQFGRTIGLFMKEIESVASRGGATPMAMAG